MKSPALLQAVTVRPAPQSYLPHRAWRTAAAGCAPPLLSPPGARPARSVPQPADMATVLTPESAEGACPGQAPGLTSLPLRGHPPEFVGVLLFTEIRFKFDLGNPWETSTPVTGACLLHPGMPPGSRGFPVPGGQHGAESRGIFQVASCPWLYALPFQPPCWKTTRRGLHVASAWASRCPSPLWCSVESPRLLSAVRRAPLEELPCGLLWIWLVHFPLPRALVWPL